MVFDYVVTESQKDADTKEVSEEVVAQGQVIAETKEIALVKVGFQLCEEGVEFNNKCKVLVRPF